MASPLDTTFCETCPFYNTLIAPDTYCAKRGLDNMHQMLGSLAGKHVYTFGGDSPTAPVEEVEDSFDESMMVDVLACIESVSNGGDPIIVRDEF